MKHKSNYVALALALFTPEFTPCHALHILCPHIQPAPLRQQDHPHFPGISHVCVAANVTTRSMRMRLDAPGITAACQRLAAVYLDRSPQLPKAKRMQPYGCASVVHSGRSVHLWTSRRAPCCTFQFVHGARSYTYLRKRLPPARLRRCAAKRLVTVTLLMICAFGLFSAAASTGQWRLPVAISWLTFATS